MVLTSSWSVHRVLASSACIVNPEPSIGALRNPRLLDVEARRVVNLYCLPVLCLDIPFGESLAVPHTQPHAAAHNRGVARLFQLVRDLPGEFLLAEAHLREGLVDGLAHDLMREKYQFLCARGDQLAIARDLLLGELDALLLGQLSVGADHLHDLFALVTDPPPRVRVQGSFHVFLHPAVGHGRDLPTLQGFRCE